MAISSITPAQINELIVSEQYHQFPGTTVTICCIELKNGYNVTGESACLDVSYFDAEKGRTIARQNAVQKIWPLAGYALKEQHALAACGS